MLFSEGKQLLLLTFAMSPRGINKDVLVLRKNATVPEICEVACKILLKDRYSIKALYVTSSRLVSSSESGTMRFVQNESI